MADALDQANAIWSSILHADQMKALGLSNEGGRQVARHKPEHKDNSRKSNRTTHKTSYDDLVAMATRLALRMEKSLQPLLQDHQFKLHLQLGRGSMLTLMLATTHFWHNGSQDTPLRHQPAVLLLFTLEERLPNLSRATSMDQPWIECPQLNLIDLESSMPYLRWGPLARMMKPAKNTTLKMDEDKTWQEIRQACYHAIWQLVRTSIRPQGTEKSNLAKSIHHQIARGSSGS
jgi:hypothetical protein